MEQKTTYSLELCDRSAFHPRYAERSDLEIKQARIPYPPLNRFFHTLIGRDYRWGGREGWGETEWRVYVERPELETWVAYLSGTPVGYAELERQADSSVRIQNFGLLPPFIGQGLGAHFLSTVVERAWRMGATRIWLNTCTHDHPHAPRQLSATRLQRLPDQGRPAQPRSGALPN